MTAHVISIGTELTYGLTVDTNSAWISRRLAELGIVVGRHVTVGDDVAAIRDAVAVAAREADLVLVNGGLGPTEDDLTRQAVADAAGVPLALHDASLDQIRGFFRRLDRTMAPTNERQALLPQGAEAIENVNGTAPGIAIRIGRSDVYVMPGVPGEMKAMFSRSIEPRLAGQGGGAAVVTRTLRCIGASEAAIGERIADLMAPRREPTVGITAEQSIISIRVIARGVNRALALSAADVDVHEVRARLGALVFGEESDTLPSVVGDMLIQRRATLATAESCTGGLLARMLTDVPGSSAYFLGGFVTYSNEFKTRFLDVPETTIEREGAVSSETAAAMAERCRDKARATYALSTTGVAGPSGGSQDKPVGLVFIGLACAEGTRTFRFLAGTHLDREAVRNRSCKSALAFLRSEILKSCFKTEPRP